MNWPVIQASSKNAIKATLIRLSVSDKFHLNSICSVRAYQLNVCAGVGAEFKVLISFINENGWSEHNHCSAAAARSRNIEQWNWNVECFMVDVVEFQEHYYDKKCMALKAKHILGIYRSNSAKRAYRTSFSFRYNYSMFARSPFVWKI